MSVPLKLGAFGLLLMIVFVATFSIGAAVGPLDGSTSEPTADMPMTDMQMDEGGG